ncbi:MAG TPA: SPOR domain-containing protein, partial [candidate division Zixibacteria bacterium]|nr:SPOR domain-containing protein [candidate division Zixibacteria bacterium]
MKKLLCMVMLAAAPAAPASADDLIYRLITQGKLDEARQELSRVSTASVRDGATLFFQALLEPDAVRAAELLEVALGAGVGAEYRELANLRLAQYYSLTKAWDKLERVIVNYRAKFEHGRYREQMMRFSTLLDEQAGAGESALRQADRYLVEYGSGLAQQWGQIDKARVLQGSKKEIGADKMLRGLAREKTGPGVPQALYLLAMDAARRGKADDAVFYYNVLREAYPNAVGLEALVDRLAVMAEGVERRAAEAEQVTGTYYTIQVGVFTDADNARTQAERFRQTGWKTEIADKTISRVTYRAVYVGRFAA